MLWLRVQAPYAAFRTFTAGWYRPTAPFLTPTAAYGLLLNIAAIEMRLDDGESAMTVTTANLPRAAVAVGAQSLPEVQTVYQQLHNYPVGSSFKERIPETRGNKYNITPVRREYLSDVDACVGLRGNEELEARVREGLRQGAAYAPEGRRRYGTPFLGDNNFLISRLELLEGPAAAYWYVAAGGDSRRRDGEMVRLTAWIDRKDMSRTRAPLYQRQEAVRAEPPEEAWTVVPPVG